MGKQLEQTRKVSSQSLEEYQPPEKKCKHTQLREDFKHEERAKQTIRETTAIHEMKSY